MKFEVLQENFSKAVATASKFASTKAQLPILGNILLTVQKSKVLVCSTNLEVSVSVSVGAKVEEEGEISIPSKLLNEIISNLPKETISLTSDKEQLKISAQGFSSTLLGMDSSDFPKVPTSIGKDSRIVLPQENFLKSLSQVLFSTSMDETRPVLTGVLFIWNKNSLILVATDGFRLSQKKVEIPGGPQSSRIILPKMILSEITKSQNLGEEILFDIKEKDKQAVFGIGDTVLSSRLLEGDYPDFEKIIPKTSSCTVLTDVQELLRAVKLASVFSRDNANIVKIKLLKDSLKVTAESSSSGSQETNVDAKVESNSPEVSAGKFEIAFNYKFLEDFLHSVAGDEVSMRFVNANSAGVFGDTSDKSYLHLIMPVKLQG